MHYEHSETSMDNQPTEPQIDLHHIILVLEEFYIIYSQLFCINNTWDKLNMNFDDALDDWPT